MLYSDIVYLEQLLYTLNACSRMIIIHQINEFLYDLLPKTKADGESELQLRYSNEYEATRQIFDAEV